MQDINFARHTFYGGHMVGNSYTYEPIELVSCTTLLWK